MIRSTLSARVAIFGLCVWFAPAALAQKKDVPATVTPERGALEVVEGEWEGRVAAAQVLPVHYVSRRYGGSLEVEAVLVREGRVERGQALLRLAARPVEQKVRAAEEALEDLSRQRDVKKLGAQLAEEAQRRDIEHAERKLEAAQRASKRLEEVGSPAHQLRLNSALSRAEQHVKNQREELQQLEAMYKGSKLADETKEIVLERARHGLQQAELGLKVARLDRQAADAFDDPANRRKVERELKDAAVAHETAQRKFELGQRQRDIEHRAFRRALRDAEEKRNELREDLARSVLVAPATGLLSRIQVQPGDAIKARQVIARVHAAGPREVEIAVSPADRKKLAAGQSVEVRAPESPEIVREGRVASVGALGTAKEKSTTFAVRVELAGDGDEPAIGLSVTVTLRGRREGAWSLPATAVSHADGAWYVVEEDGGDGVRRPVVVGARAGDRWEILEGVEEGMRVRLHANPDGAQAPLPSEGLQRAMALPVQRAASPEEARVRGVRFLVQHQNRDGSFGDIGSSRPGEIYLGTVSSLRAFKVATSALCCQALRVPARADAAARVALVRGVRYLVAAAPTARATGDTFYDTWTHAYLVEALAVLMDEPHLAELRDAMWK
ncbi:MAG: HlyD family efflux transporter periplasmic adaptor subunit, partial [Planctomycetota bacterium]